MDVNKVLQSYVQNVRETAILGALATKVLDCNKSDDLSENEAISLYGKAWLRERMKLGLVHFTRDGSTQKSKKTFSRFEIECVKYAEKGILDIVNKFYNTNSNNG